jgi:hypothetical protein
MSATISGVRALLYLVLHPTRLLALLGAVLGGFLYVWIAAVRAVPGVKDRKTAWRRQGRERARTRP